MTRKDLAQMTDITRMRLREIADSAKRAQRMSLTNDNLCDLIDEIAENLQWVTEIVNKARGTDEKGGDA